MNKGLTKGEVQFIKSLQQKEGRNTHQLFMVEGEKMLEELISSDWKVHSIYATNEWESMQIVDNEKITIISSSDLKKISALKTPNKVLALVHFKPMLNHFGNRIIFCDQLNDPGNAGTILRIADWFGIQSILLSTQSVDFFSPKVVQSSMGSIFRLNILVDHDKSKIKQLKASGYDVFSAEMKGISISDFEFPDKGILVLGSESHGVSREIQEICTHQITIPGMGKAESLNVAVACGIICAKWNKI